MAKKILLIGRASTGKTSIINAILEGEDPIVLMMKPLEPTRGIETKIYKWIDLNLSIFDTSGQEINYLFENEDEQKRAFENADIIIYNFDVPTWTTSPEDIIEEIHRVNNLINGKYKKAKLILNLHKIDLIHVNLKIQLIKLKEQIIELLNIDDNLPIYFTSLSIELISNTYNIFFEIFSTLSKETTNLKNIFDEKLKNVSKTMFIITDLNNHIIVQSATRDFEVRYVNKLYQFLEPIERKTKEISIIYDKIFFLDENSQIFSIVISDINSINKNIGNLICISEIQNNAKLIDLKNQLRNELMNYYS